MPNIAIVNYCNLKCPYCFADDMIHEKTQAITIEDFRKILDFVSRSTENYIGIIGGEPTLHPNFKEILKEVNTYCKEVDTGATLFTNGINLEPFIPEIGDRIGLLINCNSPQFQPKELFDKQRKTLDRLYELSWFDKKVTCGCNIHPGLEDYSFFWDIVDRYHLDHVRVSVVSPAAQYETYRSDKELYYFMMKPRFVQFCKDALNMNSYHQILLVMEM
jgi:pyruvate-formate lyase-activating enzyme